MIKDVIPYYESDGITLYLGDCKEILPKVKKDSVDLVLTDPPYNVVNRDCGNVKGISYNKGTADSSEINIPSTARELVRVVNGSIYVWCSTEQVSLWRQSFVDSKMTTRMCIWEKTNAVPLHAQRFWLSSIECCVFARKSKATFNRFFESPVWSGPSEQVYGFSPAKPLWLMRRIIDASSNIGDVVLDPYCGSGSTLIAARELGRVAIGMEISKKHCDIALERLGVKPTLQMPPPSPPHMLPPPGVR